MGYSPLDVFEKFHAALRAGDAAGAFRLAEESLDLCPLDHRLRWFLACALLQEGDRDAARRHFEALGRWVTTSSTLRAKLAEVGGAAPAPRSPPPSRPVEDATRRLDECEAELSKGFTAERLLAFSKACSTRSWTWNSLLVGLPHPRGSDLGARDRALAERAVGEAARLQPGHVGAELAIGYSEIGTEDGPGDDGSNESIRAFGRKRIRALFAANPGNAEAMAAAASLEDDSEKRVALLRKALETDPSLVGVHLSLGQELWYRRSPEAIQHFKRVAEQRRDSVDLQVVVGDVLFERGDWPGAAEAYLRSCSLGAILVGNYRRKAVRALLQLGRTEEAARACGMNRWFDEPDGLTLEVCARMHLEAGRDDLAMAALRGAAGLESEPFDAPLDIALLMAKKGDARGALERCERACRGRAYLERAEVVTARLHLANGDAKAAMGVLDIARSVSSGQVEALELLAEVLEALGKEEEAAAKRAAAASSRASWSSWPPAAPIGEVDCEPPTAQSLAREAERHFRQGGTTAAAALYRAVRALDPGHPGAVCHQAQHFAWDGKREKGKDLCRQALAVNPGAEEIWRFLGELLRVDRDLPAARRSVEKARDCAADPAEAWLALARLDAQEKDLAGAERKIREALRSAPERPTLWGELAEALEGQGRGIEAVEAVLQEQIWSERFDDWKLSQAVRGLPELGARERELLEALSGADSGERSEKVGLLLLSRGQRRQAKRVLRSLVRWSGKERMPALRQLWALQMEEGDWEGLLDTATHLAAFSWPDFEEAWRMRWRALGELRKAKGRLMVEA